MSLWLIFGFGVAGVWVAAWLALCVWVAVYVVRSVRDGDQS